MHVVMIIANALVIMALVTVVAFRARRWPEPAQHPYVCEVCNRGFQTGNVLAMHLRSSHGGTGQDANFNDGLNGPLKQRMDEHKWRKKLDAMPAPPVVVKRKRAAKKPHKLSIVK